MNPLTPPVMKRRQLLAAGAGLAATLALPARAQAYPSRPIRFVVPYAAGGGTDLLIRSLQEPLARSLGQPVIVDNRSGAAGAIGVREVARAAPDGYTFLVSNNGPSVIVPLLQKDAGYDPVQDFTPLTTLATAPIVLIAHANAMPATDTQQFLAWAAAQSQSIVYGTAGVGSIGHFAAEQFAKMTGTKLLHVPYRGQAPTIAAVLSGEAPIAFTSASDALLAHVQTGKIRLLGIGSEQPSPLIPGGVPIAKAVPGYRADFWQGVLAPAKLPPAIIAKVHQALIDAVTPAEMQAKYAKMGYSAAHNTPAQFARALEKEVETWKSLIRERGIRGES